MVCHTKNRRRQNDIPQFSTERAKQENKSINPYMEDTDFNEETFDMIGPNAPQEVKDAWIEAAKEEGDVDNIDIFGQYNRICNSGNETGSV